MRAFSRSPFVTYNKQGTTVYRVKILALHPCKGGVNSFVSFCLQRFNLQLAPYPLSSSPQVFALHLRGVCINNVEILLCPRSPEEKKLWMDKMHDAGCVYVIVFTIGLGQV